MPFEDSKDGKTHSFEEILDIELYNAIERRKQEFMRIKGDPTLTVLILSQILKEPQVLKSLKDWVNQ